MAMAMAMGTGFGIWECQRCMPHARHAHWRQTICLAYNEMLCDYLLFVVAVIVTNIS